MRNKNKDIAVIGFALFSMFFGAGNLLFPPYLGLVSGQSWLVSFIGFILADIGLALLVMAASAKCSGDLDQVLSRAGKNTSKLIGTAAVLCIGPLLAIPRTAATTFEMGITPILGETNIAVSVIFSVIFFGLTLALTIRPSKVVDIIGKVLTPILLIALAILIIKGIITPIGDLNPETMIENNLFQEGVSQGYLTMDALGAASLATVIITSIHEKGYTDSSDKVNLTMKAGLVAGIALTLVYGGLTYLGATLSNLPGNPYGVDTPQASLMVVIINVLLGYPGKIVLCAIVALACLTTAIGLTSATGKYFSSITKGKLKYETIVIAVCVFSAVVSNFGVGTIIKSSAPILEIVYPVLMVLVIMTLVCGNIKNDNAFKGAALATFLVSLLSLANSLWNIAPIMTKIPLASFGFNWVFPAIIGALIGGCIKNSESSSMYEVE